MKELRFLLLLLTCSGCWVMNLQPQPKTGVANGQFEPCRNAPNCVSSQAEANSKWNYVEPMIYEEGRTQALMRLLKVLGEMPRVELRTVHADYVHAEVRSRMGDFTDDLEFFLPRETKVIHLRSLSRTGWYDFKVNRKRAEEVRNRFAESL